MTKVLVAGFGWVSLVIGLDWSTKKIVGDATGTPCTARHGLLALDMAVQGQYPEGARGQAVSLLSDHGCQPTARAFMQAGRILGIPQAFTSDNHPTGTAETERVRRTVTEACRWRQEWPCPVALGRALERWITHSHAHYLHSTRGDKPPSQCEREDYSRHSTPFVAA
jgi:putative transposase